MDIKVAGSKILVADDSEVVQLKLKQLLEKEGYKVYKAMDGKECLEIVDFVNPDIILLDLDMPYVTGMEVCKKLKKNEKTSLTPVIVLTASESKLDKTLSLSAGANDFLSKSFDALELKLKVESLLMLKHAINQLENANNIIKSLAKAVEIKDKYTVGHAERVSLYATKIAERMRLDESQIKDIAMAGLLHDIGKIGVPDVILNKVGSLTDEEFEEIKKHPLTGEEICSPIKSFDKIKVIIRHHHEKLNGRGYPDGLGGNEINIETRIMAVADIYDALTSNRSYRSAMPRENALNILKSAVNKGEIDGKIVVILEKLVEEGLV